MKVRVMALCAAALFAFVSTSAEAKRHHHQHHHITTPHKSHHNYIKIAIGCTYDNDGHIRCGEAIERASDRPIRAASYRVAQNWSGEEGIVANHSGCPRIAFCGCSSSIEVFGRPVRDLYLAANWFKFPRTSPAPGMVAVRQHHVFVIRAVHLDGTVLAFDPNSGGHRTRIHTVSLRGYSVRDPHTRMAGS